MKLHPLHNFVRESWRIESVFLSQDQYKGLAEYHEQWIKRPVILVSDVEEAALHFTRGKGKLRWVHGMNVKVGRYYPPKGGPEIQDQLRHLCENIAHIHPFEMHEAFERLHPFIDGNGRVGRMIWLKGMVDRGWSISRGFLHNHYYQSLERCHQ